MLHTIKHLPDRHTAGQPKSMGSFLWLQYNLPLILTGFYKNEFCPFNATLE